MRKGLCGIVLVLAALVGYRLASDYLEDTRDYR
ncbi:hypothetical protein J2Z83_000394 [Virgibacillus natechei]|uniref:Uncharacterized protein n=1 Tax=Virgibacillus natechei TaxID=1216297 RepID=A0ABS4IBJ9_9BACI|nr:hypothetical protein [Virgibacillus natechei]